MLLRMPKLQRVTRLRLGAVRDSAATVPPRIRSQCCLGAAATPRRPQAPALVRVGTAPQTALWSYHSTTAHRQPWARPQVQLPVAMYRLRYAADNVLQNRDAE
ncbi:hypothetical protein PG991_009224 [Apiospora marii]|uniref:Uncharacterized protein n=1 Tax=Apiospora marii TaxID=335849 RepID=A0ABR1RK47_9PEZI